MYFYSKEHNCLLNTPLIIPFPFILCPILFHVQCVISSGNISSQPLTGCYNLYVAYINVPHNGPVQTSPTMGSIDCS